MRYPTWNLSQSILVVAYDDMQRPEPGLGDDDSLEQKQIIPCRSRVFPRPRHQRILITLPFPVILSSLVNPLRSYEKTHP